MFGRNKIEYKYSVGNIDNNYEDYIIIDLGYFVDDIALNYFTFDKTGTLKSIEVFEG